MTSHLDLANKNDEYEKLVRKNIAHDAAILILKGYTREEAIDKATDIAREQAIAVSDVTGVHGTLEEAQSPSASGMDEKQISAIQRELLKKENF